MKKNQESDANRHQPPATQVDSPPSGSQLAGPEDRAASSDTSAERSAGPLPGAHAAASAPPSNAAASSSSAASYDTASSSIPSNMAWRTFVVPFAVYLVFLSLEPARDSVGMFGQRYEHYPLFYTLKIVATLVALGLAWPGLRRLSWRISPWGVVVGLLGVVAWVGLCELQTKVEQRFFPQATATADNSTTGEGTGATTRDTPLDTTANPLPTDERASNPSLGSRPIPAARPAYNPFEQLRDTPLWAYVFLVIRFIGLAAVVPIIEELFWRGFVMRFFVEADWWRVPLATWNWPGIALAIGLATAMHPAEWVAALVWFSAVTFMFLRTRRIADCFVAHALTNLLLGIYVLTTGEWHYL